MMDAHPEWSVLEKPGAELVALWVVALRLAAASVALSAALLQLALAVALVSASAALLAQM